MRRIVQASTALALSSSALALDLNYTVAPGRVPTNLGPGEISLNRADRRLFFRNVDGTIGSGSLLNATGAGRRAVEQGEADDLRSGVAASAAVGLISRSLFETMQGSRFLVRPYLTDLTCGSDQTSGIRSAATAAAVVAPGAALIFPPGCIRHDATLTNMAQRWAGAGAGRSSGTELRYTAATGSAVVLMGTAAFDGFRLSTTQANSAASAIQLSDGIENPRSQRVSNIAATGFQDQVDVRSGEFWSIVNFELYNASRYGIRLRNLHHDDSGDGTLISGTVYADNPIGDTAIRMESGGGLKLAGVKTLQFNRSFELAAADGVNTGIIELGPSNSFENARSRQAIRLGRVDGGNTGIVGHIYVGAQVAGAVIVRPGVENVVLAPRIRDQPYGILIEGGDGITVSSDAAFTRLQTAVHVQDPATNVRIGDFQCTACAVRLEDQRNDGAGSTALNERRPVSLAANASRSFWALTVPPYRGAKVEVLVEGVMQNVGAINSLRTVLLTKNNPASTAAPAVTTAVPAVDAGAAITVTFDTTTSPGVVLVGLSNPNSDASRTFMGSISIRVDGRTARFSAL